MISSLALLLAVGTAPAADQTVVIQELKKLRDSLPVADSQRRELSLRIADLLANQCLILSKTTVESERLRACQEAYLIFGDTVALAPTFLQPKIRFQMARIALERGDKKSAKAWFEKTLQESSSVELKRESALRLAEIAESTPGAEAEAEKLYQTALGLCSGGDSCSFARYRIAWVLKRKGQLTSAISEMQQAIFDSRGQPRQEAIRDLIQFMGQDAGSNQTHLTFIENLGTKLAQPQLVSELGSAYFASGNKAAGVSVLEIVHSRAPNLAQNIQLLEEHYGLRNWDRFEFHLDALEDRAKQAAVRTEAAQAKSLESVSKRLALQLDGERTTNASRTRDFIRFSKTTLTLFPSISDRTKLMEGVIAALAEPALKLAQLKSWLNETSFQLTAAEQKQLHELRIGIAQKSSELAVVIEEANALIPLTSSTEEKRAYEYARAKAQYDKKDLAQALIGFQALASTGLNLPKGPDTYAIQAQNLAMDILNQQKNLDALMAQARTWTENQNLKGIASLGSELKEMAQVASQAEFEKAVGLGETMAALKAFRSHCEAGRFLPKSCENAKVLASRLDQHEDLIAILRTTGDTANLKDELEAGGNFAESAKLHESALTAQSPLTDSLKTALLYELAGKLSDRDRVLNGLPQRLNQLRTKPSQPEQMALAATAADAGLLHSGWMKISGFSSGYQAFVAERLEQLGRGTPESRKVLMNETASTGTGWNQLTWNEAMRLEALEAKIGFHTADGQRQFQRRVAALKNLNQYLEKVLSGSPSDLRVKLLRLSQNSHSRLAREILESPIPEGLTEDQLAQIRSSIAEMARPFEERSTAIAELIQTEVKKVADSGNATLAPRVASLAQAEISALLKAEEQTQGGAPVAASIQSEQLTPHLSLLHQNPRNVSALRSLKSLYESRGQIRLAKYYEGRIAQLTNSQEANR